MSDTIPSGIYETTTMEAIAAVARVTLKLETSDTDFIFAYWINQAVRHLDCLSLFQRKVDRLEVKNNIAKLPCGFYRMLAVRIGNDEQSLCGTAIYVDIPFANSCGCNMNGLGATGWYSFSNSFQIQQDKLVFNQFQNFDVNGEPIEAPITHCEIAYFGMNVDGEGMFNIYADMERALVAYVCWKYTQQNFKEYNQYIINGYRDEWAAQKKWIKSTQYYENFRLNRWAINEWASAILVDKNFAP